NYVHLFCLFIFLFIMLIFQIVSGIKQHYDVFDPWKACIKLNGQCKNQCGENEFKMSYCARPETLCCLKVCDPVE
uniref:Beta-defensin n=1 Tax=Panthera leo TaxID=9689 RepID=A0A8C8WIK2_PANLE